MTAEQVQKLPANSSELQDCRSLHTTPFHSPLLSSGMNSSDWCLNRIERSGEVLPDLISVSASNLEHGALHVSLSTSEARLARQERYACVCVCVSRCVYLCVCKTERARASNRSVSPILLFMQRMCGCITGSSNRSAQRWLA